MALNFGVYITDLTYSGLFEQAQTALLYKQSIQQLTEGLGLQSALNPGTMQRLEENINDKRALLQIISETYSSCTASLNESDRYVITLTILVGGWVESMYIATATLNGDLLLNEEKIKQLIVDQILTFDMIWQVTNELKEIPEVNEIVNNLSGLAQQFDRIGVYQTRNVVTSPDKSNVSKIESSNIINITPKDFEAIKYQVQLLRQNFTKI